MKKIMILGAMVALVLSGCTKVPADSSENGERLPEGTRLYISAGIALPTAAGTRSATDNFPENGNGETNSDEDTDFEYGYDYESDVRSVLLVIADSKDQYITHTFVSNVSESPETNQPFDFVVSGELSYEALEKAYKGTDNNGSNALLKENKEVHIWVYCNYTGAMIDKFGKLELGDTDWIDFIGTVDEKPANPSTPSDIPNTIWAKKSFLMTNANNQDNIFTFPSTIEDWDNYTVKSNPYRLSKDKNTPDQEMDLRPIRVERAAARFDFRDGSDGNNTYNLQYITKHQTTGSQDGPSSQEGESLNIFNVQLNRMALVNMSKNFYYLRRVSNDGMKNKAEVGGYEKSTNYVVDTDSQEKANHLGINNDHFNFPLFTADGSYNKDGWYVDKISEVLKNDRDNWKTQDYKIWRYVTENTIPGIENQITVQSTGIVFKGSITLGKSSDVQTALEKQLITEKVKNALSKNQNGTAATEFPDLYSFEGRLYAGIPELIQAAAEGKGSTLYSAVTIALKHWTATANEKQFKYSETVSDPLPEGLIGLTVELCNALINYSADITDPQYEEYKEYTIDFNGGSDTAVYNFNKAVAKVEPEELGITVYRASNEQDGDGWGYYCYYFYWNRHNDNGKSGKMGPMEFATVRNNVYKLAVTKISEFGHPRVTDFDPDPVDPEDPDEEPKIYFQMQVDVLPWVVRVNEIEF